MTQYATFHLDGRLFGLEILTVREINRILDITPVPKAAAHICGLINLRGQIVTILDLAVRLGLPARGITDTTHNIILKTASELGLQGTGEITTTDQVGLLVDAIGDVIAADETTIEPPSANVSEQEGRCLRGILKTDAGLLILLNLPAVLALD